MQYRNIFLENKVTIHSSPWFNGGDEEDHKDDSMICLTRC